MESKEKFDQLFAEEDFRNDIQALSSKADETSIRKRYSLTEKELAYAKKFFKSLNFNKVELPANEIDYAKRKLFTQIRSNNKNKKTANIVWIVSRVAAFLTIPLLIISLYFYQRSEKLTRDILASQKIINTIEVPAGTKSQIKLPDGSQVWLNSGSKISFPVQFSSDCRDIKLEGEAFFEVTKNEKVPMLISTPLLNVKVYGTQFNLKAYPDDGNVETALFEGKISVFSKKETKEYFIEPGQAAFYDSKNHSIQINQVSDISIYKSWKDGKLIFQNQSFAEILRQLERWYNVDIQLTDESLAKTTLYATFTNESIEQILEILSNSISFVVQYPRRTTHPDGSLSKRTIIINRK